MYHDIFCSQEEVVELGRSGDDGGTLRKAGKIMSKSQGRPNSFYNYLHGF
jgi:hypothetical protein